MPSLLPEPSAPGLAAPAPSPLFDSWFLPFDIDEQDGASAPPAANDVEIRRPEPLERARASAG